MIITIYNFKGGQGKSKIALNLALTMDYGIITNDVVSSHDLVLPEERILKVNADEDIPTGFKEDDDIIYDLGGFIDKRVIEAIKKSNFIIVPVTNENEDEENLRVSIQTIDSIEQYNKNIIIIANKTELKKSGTKIIQDDFEEIKRVMGEFYKYPVFNIRKSKVVTKVFKDKKSIKEIVGGGGLEAYAYEDIKKSFDDIINYLTTNKNKKK